MNWENTKMVMQQMADEIEAFLKNELDVNGINATGALRNSIKTNISEDEDGIELDLSILDYQYYVLGNGRGPTKNTGSGIVQRKIGQWINDKPVTPTIRVDANGNSYLPTIEELKFLITRKIHREGFEAKPGTETLDTTISNLNTKYQQLIEEAVNKDIEEDVDAIFGAIG